MAERIIDGLEIVEVQATENAPVMVPGDGHQLQLSQPGHALVGVRTISDEVARTPDLVDGACVDENGFENNAHLDAVSDYAAAEDHYRKALEIGKFRLDRMQLILIDLQHINNALRKQNAEPVNGIIGADILLKAKAIIDYDKKYLYLLKIKKK